MRAYIIAEKNSKNFKKVLDSVKNMCYYVYSAKHRKNESEKKEK